MCSKLIFPPCLLLCVATFHLAAAEIDSQWSHSTDGNWHEGSNWSSAPTVPNNTDTDQFHVTINPTSPLTVHLDRSATVSSLSLFEQGTLTLLNNNRLTVAGNSLLNSGLISLNSNGNSTDLRVGDRVELTGAGSIELGNGSHPSNSRISSNVGGTLVNVDNRIQGRGNVGANLAGIENLQGGLIDANFDQNALVLDPANDLVFRNQGILQASHGGTLVLVGDGTSNDEGNFQNQDGLVVAREGSQVQFSNANLVGGRLGSESTGEVRVLNSNNSFVKDLEFFGTIIVQNNTDFGFTGTIQNNGEIQVASTGNATDIEVQAEGTTLTGNGTILLGTGSHHTNSRIDGAIVGAQLVNTTNTISGRGIVGNNRVDLVNHSTGLIDANLNGQTLTIDPAPGSQLRNEGTVQATNGGTLRLLGDGDRTGSGGSFQNSGGLIQAGPASTVLLRNAFLQGGTLNSVEDGAIHIDASTNSYLQDLTIDGIVNVNNNSDLGLSGSITVNGRIDVGSRGNGTNVKIQSEGATLQGNGELRLGTDTNPTNSRINGQIVGAALHNEIRISGRGNVGYNAIAIVNSESGVIDANLAGQSLVVDPAAEYSLENRGTMQATNGGILVLQGSGTAHGAGGSFVGEGTIQAQSASQVWFQNAFVSDATLRTNDDGMIFIRRSSNSYAQNVILDGQLTVENNSDFGILGTVENRGTISVASTGNGTDIEVQENDVTLVGGGTIILGAGSHRRNSRIDSLGGTLISVDNTIQGRGTIMANLQSEMAILGDSPTDAIIIDGQLSGSGRLANVEINSGYNPGEGPAQIDMEGEISFGRNAHLTIDVHGTTAGTGYDQLASTGIVNVDGTLEITTQAPYQTPRSGEANLFKIVEATESVNGNFESLIYNTAGLPISFEEREGRTVISQRAHQGSGQFLNVYYHDNEIELVDYLAIPGDANGDGEFNSTDFIQVFQAGLYEDGDNDNANWMKGDWNGDQDFDSADFIAAFQVGLYEAGPVFEIGSVARQVQNVPEPINVVVAWLIFVLALIRFRRRLA